MIYTFIMLSLIIKELEANEISTLKRLWCILKSWRANHLEDMKEDTGRLEEYFLEQGVSYCDLWWRQGHSVFWTLVIFFSKLYINQIFVANSSWYVLAAQSYVIWPWPHFNGLDNFNEMKIWDIILHSSPYLNNINNC